MAKNYIYLILIALKGELHIIKLIVINDDIFDFLSVNRYI